MNISNYHAKLFSYELTKRFSSDNIEKLTSTLANAQVNLTPHQIEAALFAFKSPFSKGALLADEVGLGKTIEAGILLSQKWAENKRRILIISPSNLRKQWNQELIDKFFLFSQILESKSFNEFKKQGNINPLIQDKIVIASYHFVRNKAKYVKSISWDLVIIDEAHRLRNVYRNDNKIAKEIKTALEGSPKVLLTATPLQNSLMELYGLVSFIDDFTFGDLKSFRSQFLRLESGGDNFQDLRERLKPICNRTLRSQVLEYINYTNRIAITQPFDPTNDEQLLYDYVSDYLRRPKLYALPSSQRHLMTLILRKLLASSTYAIAGTLSSLVKRLENRLKNATNKKLSTLIQDDYEELNEVDEEWNEEPINDIEDLDPVQILELKEELKELSEWRDLAESITENSKGKALIHGLKNGMEKLEELGANKKALIFTESRRTQTYLLNTLSEFEEYKDKIILFNGENNDDKSKLIYIKWLEKNKNSDKITGSKSADMRQALVDYFKEEAVIMIATEAAAEGINLQFCSLVVNYDLPWNPQRIEQRIGRCHRYGQKFDVVVINFINQKNEADKRVFELLSEKFNLFQGVFGASDEVLGVIESGVDFEKRIVQIYQECRKPEDIKKAFDELQAELELQITDKMKSTKQKLLENFDEEVHEKLKVNLQKSTEYLNKYETWLWSLTKYFLNDLAKFDDENNSFEIFEDNNLYSLKKGFYKLGLREDGYNIYRLGHPLAQHILDTYKSLETKSSYIAFDYTNSDKKITLIEDLIGKKGYLDISNFSIEALESEDEILYSGFTDDGNTIDKEVLKRFFSLPIKVKVEEANIDSGIRERLSDLINSYSTDIINSNMEKNNNFFDEEMDKLEKWADDLKNSIEIELKELEKEIKTTKTESKKITKLEAKIEAQKSIKDMEKRRNKLRQNLFTHQDEIEEKKDNLISDIENKLKQSTRLENLFTIRWEII